MVQVKEARAKGARVLTGGEPCTDGAGLGRFFQPTLVADCDNTMSIMTKESFGPVVAVAPVDSDAQAVSLINDSEYGLTAAIFTKDEARANAISAQLAVGTVYMNRWVAYAPWRCLDCRRLQRGPSQFVHTRHSACLPACLRCAPARCDYLDPYLPWGGVKDTGKGVSLSEHGFRSVVRLKGEPVSGPCARECAWSQHRWATSVACLCLRTCAGYNQRIPKA